MNKPKREVEFSFMINLSGIFIIILIATFISVFLLSYDIGIMKKNIEKQDVVISELQQQINDIKKENNYERREIERKNQKTRSNL